jgi:hypothetical protein
MSLDLNVFRRGTHPSLGTAEHQIPVTARGDRSSRWAGIQHGDLANTIVERVEAANLGVLREQWEVGRSGAHLFGYLDLDSSRIQTDLNQLRMFDETGTLNRFAAWVTAASTPRSWGSGWGSCTPTTAPSLSG